MIRTMTREDLVIALDWAWQEGWNPGLDDADAFLAADPNGFFVWQQDDAPAAVISVVNHATDFSFLGLYICDPAVRGQGIGFALWQAALKHSEGRTVGLDGVVDQQENYRESGFRRTGQTVRYLGPLDGRSDPSVALSDPARDMPALLALDRAANGVARLSYASAWFKGATTRHTLVKRDGSRIVGYATVRKCVDGAKVGPLFAEDERAARALLSAAATLVGGEDLALDVPDSSVELSQLAEGLGMKPVFGTARMYRGTPPVATPPSYHAVMTLELG